MGAPPPNPNKIASASYANVDKLYVLNAQRDNPVHKQEF
jgi:hypothetical protein